MSDEVEISISEYAALMARGARIHYKRARIQMRRVPAFGGNGETERRFVMEGPSGTHSLLVSATDRERLNAHWRVFATDPRNDWPEAAHA